jgi:lathosterol oxidase
MSEFAENSIKRVLEELLAPNIHLWDWPKAFFAQYFSHSLEESLYVMMGIGLCLLLKGRKIYNLPLPPQQLRNEIKQGVKLLAMDTLILFLVLRMGIIHFSQTTLLEDSLVFAGHFLFFEVYFYIMHRVQHTRVLFRFHGIHHRARICRPATVLYQSLVDRSMGAFGFLLPLCVASYFNMLNPVVTVLVATVNALIGILMHTNTEWLFRLDRGHRISKIFHSAASHSLHHARVEGNYGYLTSVIDHVCGTFIPDTALVSDQAWRGQGLSHLRQSLKDTSGQDTQIRKDA